MSEIYPEPPFGVGSITGGSGIAVTPGQPGGAWGVSVIPAGPSQNFLIDGSCQIAQKAPENIVFGILTTPTYTPCDMWQSFHSIGSGGGVVLQGGLGQGAVGPCVVTSGINYPAAGEFTYRQRIEGVRSRAIAQRGGAWRTVTASFSAVCYNASSGPSNCVLQISTCGGKDDWTTPSVIYTGAIIVVPPNTVFILNWNNITLGDCSNGLQVDIKFGYPAGGVVNNIYFTDAQLVPVAICPPYIPRLFADELRDCQRYYWKSFPYSVQPGLAVGSAGACVNYDCYFAGVANAAVATVFPTTMRIPTAAMPAGAVATYSPNLSSTAWFNASRGADSGVVATGGSDRYLFLRNPQVAADAPGQAIRVHATVDVRLPTANSALFDLHLPQGPMINAEGEVLQPAAYLVESRQEIAALVAKERARALIKQEASPDDGSGGP